MENEDFTFRNCDDNRNKIISCTSINLVTFSDGKTAAFLQGREYLAFDTLLNVVPEEDLYYVNFGDPSVMNFFSTHYVKLHKRKV